MPVVGSGGKRMDVMNMVEPIAPHLSGGEDAMDTDAMVWDGLDWSGAIRAVNHTQARIAKAHIEGRDGLVMRLQHMLLNSFMARCIAVREVTEGINRNVAGVDGVVWTTSAEKLRAATGLLQRGYSPSPLRPVRVGTEGRGIRVATMRDRAMQELFALTLEPIYEVDCRTSGGMYRSYRTVRGAVQGTIEVLSGGRGTEWIVTGRIGCGQEPVFRQWVKGHIPLGHDMTDRLLDAVPFTEGGRIPTYAGRFPSLLFDIMLNEMTTHLHDVTVIRNSGDMILVCDGRNRADRAINDLAILLSERGLRLSSVMDPQDVRKGAHLPDHTVRITADGSVRVVPSDESVHRVEQGLKAIVKRSASATQDMLIEELNPVMERWVRGHVSTVSRGVFHDIDHYLWGVLWNWARRRHNDKSAAWVHGRYWVHEGDRWEFRGERSTLLHMSDIGAPGVCRP